MSAADPIASLDSRRSGPSVGQVLRALRKRLWIIVALTSAVAILTGLYTSKLPKRYEAHTSLVIDSTVPQYLGQDFRDVVDVASSWWSSQETIGTELRVLGSHSQAYAVAEALCATPFGAARTPALNELVPGDCHQEKTLETAAPLLQALVQTEPVKDSRIVILSVTLPDPQLVALVTNTMAEVYVQRNLQHRLTQSEGAATWLGDEYGDLTQQLNNSEQALIEFKKKNDVVAVAIEDQQNDLSMRRKKLTEELNSVQVRLITLRAQREEYGRLGSTDPLNDITPANGEAGAMVKLKELYIDQYGKLLELKGKYLEKHPAVIAQAARVDSIRDDLRREAQVAARTLEAQYQTLSKEERDLHAALETATHGALQLEQRAIEYNHLKRNFDRLSKLSDQVGGRERETSLAGHLKTNNVRVLDAAIAPSAAVAPDLTRAVTAGAVIGLLLGIALAFLFEVLDATVKTQDDIEKTLGLVFLGLIPSIRTDGNEPATATGSSRTGAASKELFVLAHPKSSVAECCRAIRTNLLFMSPDNPTRTLLVTSAGPQEGKTTTAVNLAISMAQSGLRVLIVDTDMRRPRLHKVFDLPATSDGLSRAIVGDIDCMSAVRETGVPNLSFLPCGAIPPNPAELLHADRFHRIVAELAAKFDRLIFDSPPVGAVTDAAILARSTSGIILIAKGGKTGRDALARARQQLTVGGPVNILGCILNDVDFSQPGSYGHYYSRYGSYYGDDSVDDDPAEVSA